MTTVTTRAGGSRWRLVGWLVGLSVALRLLHWAGSGALAAPSLSDPSGWGAWYAARTPPEILVAGFRVLALGLGWYLMAVMVIGALARLLRLGRLVTVTDLVTVPSVRRLLHGTLGVGLAAAVLTTAPGPLHMATAEAQAPATATAEGTVLADAAAEDPRVRWGLPIDGPHRVPADDHRDHRPFLEVEHESQDGPVRGEADGIDWADRSEPDVGDLAGEPYRAFRDGRAETEPAAVAAAAQVGPDDAESAATEVLAAEHGTHTIDQGEHLWGVAHQTLENAWGRAPDDAEVAGYWHRLIERNRDRLPYPEDPDLVYPGTTIELPSPTGD